MKFNMHESMIRKVAPLLAIAVLSGCTRAANETPLEDAKAVTSGPALRDAKLPLDEPTGPGPLRPMRVSLAFPSATYSTANYLRLVDDLAALGRLGGDSRVTDLATRLHTAFRGNPANFTHTTFLASPLPEAIVGEGEGPIREAAAGLHKSLSEAIRGLNAILARRYQWPRSLDKLVDGIPVLDAYVGWLIEQLQGARMTGTLKAAAEMQIKEQYRKLRPSLLSLASSLDGAQRLAQATAALRKGIRDLGIPLGADDKARLQQAEGLATQLGAMRDAQGGLGVLVALWKMTPADRRDSFKSVSEQLYDFLATKNDEELECLARAHCPNPALGIAKLVIFGKLEEYGLTKLRDQVDKTVRDELLASVHKQMVAMMPQIPVFVRESVEKQTKTFLDLLAKMRNDAPAFLRTHVTKWASEHLNMPLRGLEAPVVRVALPSRDAIVVAAPPTAAAGVALTGAEVIGASLAEAPQFLPTEDGDALRAGILEPMLKLVSLGGFRQASGKPYPGFRLPIDGPVTKVFDLRTLLADPVTYAVPDAFQADAAFRMDRVHAKKNVGLAGQSELLRGISRQLLFFRDWEQNLYDVSLGRVLAEELVPEVPQGLVRTPFLPKDALFALALGNAAGTLQNLILKLSPAFVVLENESVLWGDRYQEIRGDKISTLAGIVSIVDGKRSGTARTAEIARYILALDEFMGATEGIENSTAAALQRPTDGGRSTLLADIVEARKKLQLLEMGLANFLVLVAERSDGSLLSSFKVGDHVEKLSTPLRLEDQVLGVRALLAVGKRLDLPLLRWAALDVYYGMNKNLFDSKRRFYAAELDAEGKPARDASFDDVVRTLRMGEELAEFMTGDVKDQWEKLSRPYARALGDL